MEQAEAAAFQDPLQGSQGFLNSSVRALIEITLVCIRARLQLCRKCIETMRAFSPCWEFVRIS